MTGRIGDWISTSRGEVFWPLDPRTEEVHLEDIAHALSHICRWGGHARTFYSVSQHCVHVSEVIEADGHGPKLALMGLLHDASEAYIGDMVTPVKRHMPLFYDFEQKLERAIYTRYNLHSGLDVPFVMPPEVVHADQVLLATEKRDLTNQKTAHLWDAVKTPLVSAIDPWTSSYAKKAYLDRFDTLFRSL